MKGFTLVDLLVVVFAVGVVFAVLFPKYGEAVERTQAAKAVQVLKYMHRQAQSYDTKEGKSGWGKDNKTLHIFLGKDFVCRWTGDGEVCCNEFWCYDNNSFTWGDKCAVTSNLTPVAARVNGVPKDFRNIKRKYLLEMEDCEGGSGRIACYESGRWCNMFQGEGKPID